MHVAGWHDTPEGAKRVFDWGFRLTLVWAVLLIYGLMAAHPYLKHNEYFGVKRPALD